MALCNTVSLSPPHFLLPFLFGLLFLTLFFNLPSSYSLSLYLFGMLFLSLSPLFAFSFSLCLVCSFFISRPSLHSLSLFPFGMLFLTLFPLLILFLSFFLTRSFKLSTSFPFSFFPSLWRRSTLLKKQCLFISLSPSSYSLSFSLVGSLSSLPILFLSVCHGLSLGSQKLLSR